MATHTALVVEAEVDPSNLNEFLLTLDRLWPRLHEISLVAKALPVRVSYSNSDLGSTRVTEIIELLRSAEYSQAWSNEKSATLLSSLAQYCVSISDQPQFQVNVATFLKVSGAASVEYFLMGDYRKA